MKEMGYCYTITINSTNCDDVGELREQYSFFALYNNNIEIYEWNRSFASPNICSIAVLCYIQYTYIDFCALHSCKYEF